MIGRVLMYNVLSTYMLVIPINIFWYFPTNYFMNVSIYSYLDRNMEDWYQALLLFWWMIPHTVDYYIYLNVQRIIANYKYINSTKYIYKFSIDALEWVCVYSIGSLLSIYMCNNITIYSLHILKSNLVSTFILSSISISSGMLQSITIDFIDNLLHLVFTDTSVDFIYAQ